MKFPAIHGGFLSGQSLRFYCEDCETGICASCADIEHREHATVRMSDAVDAEKEELRKLVEKARTQVCNQNVLCK